MTCIPKVDRHAGNWSEGLVKIHWLEMFIHLPGIRHSVKRPEIFTAVARFFPINELRICFLNVTQVA